MRGQAKAQNPRRSSAIARICNAGIGVKTVAILPNPVEGVSVGELFGQTSRGHHEG